MPIQSKQPSPWRPSPNHFLAPLAFTFVVGLSTSIAGPELEVGLPNSGTRRRRSSSPRLLLVLVVYTLRFRLSSKSAGCHEGLAKAHEASRRQALLHPTITAFLAARSLLISLLHVGPFTARTVSTPSPSPLAHRLIFAVAVRFAPRRLQSCRPFGLHPRGSPRLLSASCYRSGLMHRSLPTPSNRSYGSFRLASPFRPLPLAPDGR